MRFLIIAFIVVGCAKSHECTFNKANTGLDATSDLQACLDGARGEITIPPGVYVVSSAVFINQSNITIRGPATILASNTNQAKAVLWSEGNSNITIVNLTVDGNRDGRAWYIPTLDALPDAGGAYNMAIHNCNNCQFVGLTSQHSLKGTGLEFSGANAVFDSCVFQDNGYGVTSRPIPSWSDGLTVLYGPNLSIMNSVFMNNSDVNLIIGYAPNGVITNNTIQNDYNFSFAGLMLAPFGAQTADFTNAIVSQNTINCLNQSCGIALMVGGDIWSSGPLVTNGTVTDNVVSGGVMGLSVAGASGTVIQNNTVNDTVTYTNQQGCVASPVSLELGDDVDMQPYTTLNYNCGPVALSSMVVQ